MEDKKMLKDEQLEKVSGGGVGVGTIMICSSCGFQTLWYGNYVSQCFECTNCSGTGTFKGTSTCVVPEIQPETLDPALRRFKRSPGK